MKKYLLPLILLGLLVLPCLASAQSIAVYVANIAKIALLIAESIVVIGWVIVAILFLTSAGNPERLSLGKKALIWAIVGTVIVVLINSIQTIIKNTLGA